MDTMKRFFVYLILFILLYSWSVFFTGMALYKTYKRNDNYLIVGSSPTITVAESKQTSVNGYIKGKIVNNTGGYIGDINLKATFYNKKGEAFAIKGIKFTNFMKEQEIGYKLNHRYSNVDHFTLEMTKEEVQDIDYKYDPFIEFAVDNRKVIWFVASLIVMWNVPAGYLGFI